MALRFNGMAYCHFGVPTLDGSHTRVVGVGGARQIVISGAKCLRHLQTPWRTPCLCGCMG